MAKRKKMVFVKSANCATLNILGTLGTTISVGSKTVKINDIVYDKPIEIDIFVRNGAIVPFDSKEARDAIGQRRERLVIQGEDATIRGKEIDEEKSRGLAIDREEDYVEKDIPKRPTGPLGRAENVSSKEVAEIQADMREAGSVAEQFEETVDGKGNVQKVLIPKKSVKKARFVKAKPGMKREDHMPLSSSIAEKSSRHDSLLEEKKVVAKAEPKKASDIDRELKTALSKEKKKKRVKKKIKQ